MNTHFTLQWPLCKWMLVLAVVWLLLSGVFSKRGWMDWRGIVRQNEQLDAKIALAKKEKQQLDLEIKALKLDQDVQERTIRKHLGYIRSNEIVVEFD